MARIFGCMLGLCLLLGAGGARAAGPGAKATLERAVASLPAGWTVRYADVAEAADGALTLKEVVVSHDGKLLLAAATVKVAGLHGDGSAGAPYAADRVEAGMLGEPGASDPAAADALVMTGVAVGPGDAGGLPAGSDAAAIVQALTAVKVDHAELTHLHGKDMTIARMAFDHLAQGKVAAASIGDVASHDTSDGQTVTVATIEANDVDVARLVKVFVPSAYAPAASPAPGSAADPKDVPRTDVPRLAVGPAVGRFAVHGFAVVKADDATAVDAIEVTDLRLGQAPQAPEGKTIGTVPGAVGAAVIGGVHHHPKTGSEASFDIESIALTNYRNGGFDALQFGKVTFNDPSTHATLGMKSAAIRAFDASSLLGWATTPTPTQDDPDAAGPPPPRFGGFEINELYVVSPAGDRITVGAIRDTLAYQDKAPVSQELTVSRLTVPSHALAETVPPQALAAFARDSVTADLDFKLAWNPETHDLALAPLQIRADDLGTLTLKVTLGNVDLSMLSKGAGPAMAGLVVATVKGGELVYADHSLLSRAIAGYAAMTGKTPQQVTQGLVATLTKMKSPLPSRPLLPATLAGFIQHPGTFTVRIAPAQPIPAAMLAAGSPDDTAQKLALDVTAK